MSISTGRSDRAVLLLCLYAAGVQDNTMQDKKFYHNDSRLRDGTAVSVGCRLTAARVFRHDACSSGNAALWFILVLAALVVITLASMMGRGTGTVPEPVYRDERRQEQVQEPAAGTPYEAQRQRRQVQPDFKTPAERQSAAPARRSAERTGVAPEYQPRDDSFESRYEFMRSTDEPSGLARDRRDAGLGFDGGDYRDDDYALDADVSGSSDAATPA
jgi:hypothetical protein